MAFDGSSFWPKELQLALTGQLEAYLQAADETVLKAARFAVVEVTTQAKERLRAMVVQAGLGKEGAGSGKGTGRSLASAVRGDVYPKTGLARDPAGWIYVQPSSTRIFEAFATGPTIQAKDGGLLVIPIPGSPADRKVFGDKPRGSSVLEAFKARGIESSFVPARGSRPAMLVASSVRLGVSPKGKSRVTQAKATKSGGLAKGAQSVPLFWLVPEVKVPKRLDWDREFARISNDFVAEFSVEFARQLEFLGAGERVVTLKTKIAIDALKAAFTVSGLPAPVRNEVRLVEFLETGTPGFRWRLAIIDGDWTTNQTELGGDGPGYEMSASMQVAFMVEGEAGDARDAIFDAGVEVLSTCLPPNTTLGGAVESLDLSDEIVREHYILDNAPPVEAITLKVDLNITAPTKFG